MIRMAARPPPASAVAASSASTTGASGRDLRTAAGAASGDLVATRADGADASPAAVGEVADLPLDAGATGCRLSVAVAADVR
jgi:hypothetical protein